jgi:Anti-sigma factor NepR
VRPNADGLKGVRAGIGAALQVLYSGVLREEIPDRIVELLQKKLGQQKEGIA